MERIWVAILVHQIQGAIKIAPICASPDKDAVEMRVDQMASYLGNDQTVIIADCEPAESLFAFGVNPVFED